jgi:hypothetical protein
MGRRLRGLIAEHSEVELGDPFRVCEEIELDDLAVPDRLAVAREAGISRFVAQSFASMRNAREGGPVKTEEDPLDPTPVKGTRETNAAMRHLEEAVTGAGGLALRYGSFYGADNDGLVEPVRKRRFPIVG